MLFRSGASRMLWVRLPGDRFRIGEYLLDVTVNYGGATGITQRVQLNLLTPPGDDAPTPAKSAAGLKLLGPVAVPAHARVGPSSTAD